MAKVFTPMIKLLALLSALLALWALQLPLLVDIVLLIALILLYCVVAYVEAIFASVGITTSCLVYYALLGYFLPIIPQHYREHEKYVLPEAIYQANVDATISMPHGDLLTIDPTLPRDLPQPREVKFKTDSHGYRNNREYQGERDVLLGDSFLVGNGISQADTLPEIVRTQYALPNYSLAHPADPIDYERRAAWALQTLGKDVQFSFFFYEGNDFGIPGAAERFSNQPTDSAARYARFRLSQLQKYFWNPLLPQTQMKFVQQIERRVSNAQTPSTYVGTVDGKSIAYFSAHTAYAIEADRSLVLDLNPDVWSRTKCAFYIPTKARVYPQPYDTATQTKLAEIPSVSFKLLEKALTPFGVTVVDLSQVLRDAALKAIVQHQLLYWRDDTHWNPAGIQVVAPYVAECLKKQSRANVKTDARIFTQSESEIHFDNRLFKIAPASGAIDTVFMNAHSAIYIGWVGKSNSEKPARILAVSSGQIISETYGRIVRDDTARIIGDASKYAGFELSLPLPLYTTLKKNPDTAIQVYAVFEDGTAFVVHQ